MAVRTKFEKELAAIKLDVIKMCGDVKRAIENCIKSLIQKDHKFARAVLEGDAAINRMENEVERMCYKVFLSQQPVASDFRRVTAAMRIVSDLERIGDQASGISSAVLKFDEGEEYIKKLEHIPAMGKLAVEMISNCIDFYVNDDVELARKTMDADDEMDKYYSDIKAELKEVVKKDPKKNIDQAMEFLIIAKHLEKIGDHAVNICSWVNFANTGTRRFDEPND